MSEERIQALSVLSASRVVRLADKSYLVKFNKPRLVLLFIQAHSEQTNTIRIPDGAYSYLTQVPYS